MKIITSVDKVSVYCLQYRKKNPRAKIGLVPTMGFIHEGHLSLVREAIKQTDHVVVSIFVNPMQFNQKEDFKKYPRDLQRDIKILRRERVDVLFLPEGQDVYPEGQVRTQVSIPELLTNLCAPLRPGHFEGVLLIVYYLFHWIKPHKAFFGEKDYQQLLCVRAMARDLQLDVRVIAIPTVRDKTGLALSSRNQRLSLSAKKEALIIYEAFKVCEKKWQEGASSRELNRVLRQRFKDHKTDYAGVYHVGTLAPFNDDRRPSEALLAVAVYFGRVRLIDNYILK